MRVERHKFNWRYVHKQSWRKGTTASVWDKIESRSTFSAGDKFPRFYVIHVKSTKGIRHLKLTLRGK